ncbi:MAG: metallophosphoesterase [Myxococcota bacterium]
MGLRSATSVRSRVFVGDVQGCADELDDLLEAIAYDPERHDLWFVGDLVNRGPASARLLRRAIELDAGSVLGNHDLHLLATAKGERRLGDRDTFQDVLAATDREELLAWLRRRRLVECWEDVVLVHAGLHPGWAGLRAVASPLEAAICRDEIPQGDPDLSFFVSVRHCDERGDRPVDDRSPGPGYLPWDHWYRGERIVVCGHWSARGLVQTARVCSLDTGCVWGGSLTAWIFDEDRIVSVPARAVHQTIS